MLRRVLIPGGALAIIVSTGSTPHAQACGANPIVCENTLPGNPASDWDISGSGDSCIQGFATDISVDQGQTVRFKISLNGGPVVFTTQTIKGVEYANFTVAAGTYQATYTP